MCVKKVPSSAHLFAIWGSSECGTLGAVGASPLWGSKECLGWCAPSIYLLDFMGVRRLVPSDLRWHVQFSLKNFSIATSPALLSLLDAPWGSDPAFFVTSNRYRQLGRFLAYRPEEEGRTYRLLDTHPPGPLDVTPLICLLELQTSPGTQNRKVGSELVSLLCA